MGREEGESHQSRQLAREGGGVALRLPLSTPTPLTLEYGNKNLSHKSIAEDGNSSTQLLRQLSLQYRAGSKLTGTKNGSLVAMDVKGGRDGVSQTSRGTARAWMTATVDARGKYLAAGGHTVDVILQDGDSPPPTVKRRKKAVTGEY